MTVLTLSLSRIVLPPEGSALLNADGLTAVLVHDGDIKLSGRAVCKGEGVIAAAKGVVSNSGTKTATVLGFTLSKDAVENAVASEKIEVTFPCILRLDEVAFPPGAQAYRHVHTGPGFRHLRWGALSLQADDHAFEAAPGETWFEAAHSPVRATASSTAPETRFVRCMILPPEFLGKATIQILDPVEAALPKRQVTHRHIDHLLDSMP